MGAAISLFDGAAAVQVPPTRFQPVKKCADLLSPALRPFPLPGRRQPGAKSRPPPQHASRSTSTLLSIQKSMISKNDLPTVFPASSTARPLTVKGDVYFESDVVIKGTVFIHNTGPSPAVISAGTVIDKNLSF
jgi:hypothetical protein